MQRNLNEDAKGNYVFQLVKTKLKFYSLSNLHDFQKKTVVTTIGSIGFGIFTYYKIPWNFQLNVGKNIGPNPMDPSWVPRKRKFSRKSASRSRQSKNHRIRPQGALCVFGGTPSGACFVLAT